MSALLEKLGSGIRTLRQIKGFSQENMADTLGMSVSGYGKIERGESDISLTRIEEVAKALGITGSELLELGKQGVTVHNNKEVNGQQVGSNNTINYHENKALIDTLQQTVAALTVVVEKLSSGKV